MLYTPQEKYSEKGSRMGSSEMWLKVALGAMALVLYVNHHHLKRKKPFPRASRGIEFWVVVGPSLWTASLILYVIGVEWHNITLPLPLWLRWVGVALMALCFPLSQWVYNALGEHFTRRLALRDDHKLVMKGPYKYVRHPMYSVLFLCAIATCLISANVFVLATTLVVAVIMLARIRKEERMLQERFGTAYKDYQRRTGALVPRVY